MDIKNVMQRIGGTRVQLPLQKNIEGANLSFRPL
jgi:hypothetical protein